MSRTKIEQCYRKMQADAKSFGAELLTDESIFIDDDHLDPVWYGGYIGGLKYKGYEVSLEVHGDVEITGFMNGRDFLYKNRQNTGAMNMAASDTLRTTFQNDAELWDALNADEESENKVTFENNSWIEAFVLCPSGCCESVVADWAYNVLDACGDISTWISLLEDKFIRNKMPDCIDRNWLLSLYDDPRLTEEEQDYPVPYRCVRQNILDAPSVEAVPVSELLELRDWLYENDQIYFRGLGKLNALIAKYTKE